MKDLEKNIFAIQVSIFFDPNSSISTLNLAQSIQEEYRVMFPNEPQIMPIPFDAPREIPRCIFAKENGSASLTFSLERLDFKGIIKDGSLWRINILTLLNSLTGICKKHGIIIKRIGVVVDSKTYEELDSYLAQYISINDFNESFEKTISWINKIKTEDIIINVCVTIQKNIQIPDTQNNFILDVNTDMSSSINNEKLEALFEKLLNILKEKMDNVF